jgi:UDP-2-acetamido-3-amino-2,3-dideoxy-glucuronate N-acetyltransferase
VVCDADPAALARVQEAYPGIATYPDYADVLASAQIRAVVLATPAAQHAAGARAALEAGKHVLVEKPLALHAAEAEELKRLAAERGLVLMVGHLLEYHPAFVTLKELVAAGELGQVIYASSHRLGFGKIRQEENALWSLAPHDFSMIVRLLGEMPESVQASGKAAVTPGITDAAVATLSFPGGARAHVFVSWLHPFKERRLVVTGTKGMAVFDDMAKDGKLTFYASRVEWVSGRPVAAECEPQLVPHGSEEPLRTECDHFLTCIRTGAQPLTDGDNGLRITRILEGCQQSMDRDGERVPLAPAAAKTYFAHATAVVDDECEIGDGTKIWHFTHVLARSRIGRNCVIGQNVSVGPEVSIGNNVKIQNNVSIYKGVTLEDDVFAGPSCVFTNVFNPRSHVRRMHELRPTLVKRGATIGANATIVCGNTIGRYAMIGAGAVITSRVPDYALVYGNPGRVRGWVCNCGEKLDFGAAELATCERCKRRYEKHGDSVQEKET